jgi:type II secretory pathway pseudopilin PulG
MNALTILNRMKLRGQSESGYAMAVLLVALGVMAVMLTVAMPVWKQMSQREKEAELIFRGQQYVRAIGRFERKYANTPPPTFDVLVKEHFLRKKYKDPITDKDFVPIPAGAAGVGAPGSTQAGRGASPAVGNARGSQPTPTTTTGSQPTPTPTGGPGIGGAVGGIIGVTSASKETSVRIYNGASHYNEWRFVYAAPAATPGAGGGPGSAVPGGRSGPPGPGGPPGRGGPPASNGPFGGGPFGPNGRGPAGPGPGGPNRGGPGGPTLPFPPNPGR